MDATDRSTCSAVTQNSLDRVVALLCNAPCALLKSGPFTVEGVRSTRPLLLFCFALWYVQGIGKVGAPAPVRVFG